ncbi:MAG TPA: hypothetical protein PK858_09290, partial [Saprospiraceae bacterium]|nr:hypothetical protein [Saprospiraceae bacterium]
MDFKFRLLAQKTDMLPYYPLIHQLNSAVTEARYIHLLDDMVAHGYRMLIVMQNDTCVGLSGI